MVNDKEEAQKIQEQAEREAQEKAAKEKAALDAGSAPATPREAGTPSPLEEARTLDKSIKEGNAEFRKLVERQEKAFADSQIAGKGFAAPPTAPGRTPEEQESRDTIKKFGKSTGAAWATDMEKEDAPKE